MLSLPPLRLASTASSPSAFIECTPAFTANSGVKLGTQLSGLNSVYFDPSLGRYQANLFLDRAVYITDEFFFVGVTITDPFTKLPVYFNAPGTENLVYYDVADN